LIIMIKFMFDLKDLKFSNYVFMAKIIWKVYFINL